MGGANLALSQGRMLKARDLFQDLLTGQVCVCVEETSKTQEEALKKGVVEKTKKHSELACEGSCNETR